MLHRERIPSSVRFAIGRWSTLPALTSTMETLFSTTLVLGHRKERDFIDMFFCYLSKPMAKFKLTKSMCRARKFLYNSIIIFYITVNQSHYVFIYILMFYITPKQEPQKPLGLVGESVRQEVQLGQPDWWKLLHSTVRWIRANFALPFYCIIEFVSVFNWRWISFRWNSIW